MQSRTIAHLDTDAFFASVEQAADARLRGQPITVGGEMHSNWQWYELM